MDLSKINGERFDLAIPITKYNESTGEFEAWATIEQIDKSNEIIDIDKSWPYFEAHSQKFATATDGQSFGNVREQHDPKKAAGKLIAPPEIRKHESGARGVYIKGVAVDASTKEKLAARVLVGVSIGGRYVGDTEKVTVGGRDAKKFTADPSEYSLVDNPCVPDALITVVKADGSESIDKAKGFNPPQGFLCRGEEFHEKKDDARKCEEHVSKVSSLQDDSLAAKPSADATNAEGKETKETPPDEADDSDEVESAADQGDGKKKKKKLNGQKADEPEAEKIDASRRKALPESEFGLPSQRKYPIDTKARARNALARAAQNATPAEQSEIKSRVKAKYPDIDSTKSVNPVVEKCLSCVSQLASIISNSEGLVSWLENVEAYDDNDGAEYAIAEQIEQANSILYAALHDMVDDAQEDAQGSDYDEGEQSASPVNAVTDNQPALQMAALVETLKKKDAIRTLLTKSLRVRTGNGSSVTLKEEHMEKNEKPPVADGDLAKVVTEGFAKIEAQIGKAIEPVAAKIEAMEKAHTEQDARNKRLDDVLKSIVDKIRPATAAKRVVAKSDDSKVDEHGKSEKTEKTALEKLAERLENPLPYEAGRLVRPQIAE